MTTKVPVASLLFLGACGVLGGAPTARSGGASEGASDWGRAEWQTVVAQPATGRPMPARSDASLRGLSVVDANVVWVGGSGGTLLRSLDGGHSWQDVAPPDAAKCDFRDVQTFDRDTAIAMVAGQPARIYRTADGGRTWTIVHQDARAEAFFDAMTFEGDTGFLFGDPMDGAFTVLRSDDRGEHWRAVDRAALPAPIGAEAAFAASGSCIDLTKGIVRIVTGGTVARLLASRDHGSSWTALPLPLRCGGASQGAFGLGADGEEVVVVGGDYAVPVSNEGTVARSVDAGRSWHEVATGAGGFRSGVASLGQGVWLAVGERGCSLSCDHGSSWQAFGREGFHAVARGRDGSVFACGGGGRVARLVRSAP
jgi:photosystem II stability/assembly factor-like uncharacterized protein